MITWPSSLIEELGAHRCIIFIGAGASAGCMRNTAQKGTERPPSWQELLNGLLAKATKATTEDRDIAQQLMSSGRFLEAAEVLKAGIHTADFSAFIGQTFKDYQNTDLHQYLNDIDLKILITTNFDKVYEQFCLRGEGSSGYVVHRYYDDGLVARLRSPQRLIVKAHGCMDTPEKTVLTKSEFFSARQQHPGFFKVLESLFLTHTLLFIGYSLTDPDIQLILENSTIAAASAHPHYAAMPTGTHESLKMAFKKTYNVDILEYDPANSHIELVQSLEALRDAVADFRVTYSGV
jgi:hypothetical protein